MSDLSIPGCAMIEEQLIYPACSFFVGRILECSRSSCFIVHAFFYKNK